MGGTQAPETVAYPDRVVCDSGGQTRHSAAIAFNEAGRQAIADLDWNEGNYYGKQPPGRGLSVARMVGHITYMSDDSMREKFGRRLRGKENFSFGFDVDFEVESYLRHRGSQFVNRFDANSYLYITKAMDYFDLTNGTTPPHAQPAQGAFLVISFSPDPIKLSVAGDGARCARNRDGVCGAAINTGRFLPGGCGGADRPGARVSGEHVREGAMTAVILPFRIPRSERRCTAFPNRCRCTGSLDTKWQDRR